MAIIPPYLTAGDTIGIVCPSGFMPVDQAQTCIETLKEWGYQVKIGTTLGHQYNYFSGTDDQRLDDLQQMLDDESVQAVLCARGGYGLSRIIDRISFKKFKKNPKWIIGYSDITVLHSHVYARYKIASLHSPMAAAFNDGEWKHEYIQSLQQALAGKRAKYACDAKRNNREGAATGKLVGGNLSLMAHLVGTRSAIKTEGKIMFLEDLGEYTYHIDRMLYQLKRSGQLDGLAGLIIGHFTEMKDTVIPFGKDVYEVFHDIVKEYNYPVCFGFPVGHTKENYALKIGVTHTLHVGETKVTLEEK